MMAGFGAAVLDPEVETDANVRVTISKEHAVGILCRSM